MKENPKITVITVTFNLKKNGRSNFFKQCLESVHNQTYKNIEHLIIDGASSDGTLEILKEYSEKKWIKYFSESDSGHWNAMNKGIKKASGKYIIFLNSDDFFIDNTGIEKCITELEKNAEDCYSVCSFQLINSEGDILQKKIDPLPKELFYRQQTYNHETLICPKKIYEKLGYHNEKYKSAIDYEFNYKLVANGYNQIYVPICLTAMRTGGCTVTENGGVSEASVQNVTTFWRDIYPWANWQKQEVEKCLKHNMMKSTFLKQIVSRLRDMNIKNIDYSVIKNDIKLFYINNNSIIKLFFIPIFGVRRRVNRADYYLFNLFPVIRVKYKINKGIIYLFSLIPFIRFYRKYNKIISN